jgi:CRISPR-associated endonuclease/helicase Cas3
MEQPVDSDARVMTRLGADGLLVRLPEATLGAFGQVITQISIPAWMVAGSSAAIAVDSVRVTQARTGIVIAVGDRAFHYGPHGLERMAQGNDAVS